MENVPVPATPIRIAAYSALFALILALAAPAAHASSVCPAAPAEAAITAQRASDAFAGMDGAAFDLARATLSEQLGCLASPPDPSQAAAFHLVEALAAFKVKDTAKTLAELQAMHESDPTFKLSAALAPPGGPLQRRDAEARALPASARAPHGLSQDVFVDGREALDLPTSRPALVVVVGTNGEPLWSGPVAAGASIPVLFQPDPAAVTAATTGDPSSSMAGTTPPVVVAKRADRSSDRSSRPMLYAAGGSAVVAGVLTAMYIPASQRVSTAGALIATEAPDSEWNDAFGEVMEPTEVSALRTRARTYEVGAQAAAGLALGLGVVGLVIKW